MVPKKKRNESKIEFDAAYFKVMNDAIALTNNKFGIDEKVYNENKYFVDSTCKSIMWCGENLLIKIRIANSIYPQYYQQYIKRRMYQDQAIGICFAILTKYQIAMQVLGVNNQKYVQVIDNLQHQINSIKKWRESDNRFKKIFKKQ